MRTKEFLVRLLVFLPIALWSVFLFLMVFGIAAYLLGANSLFYCTIYCKIGMALFILATIAVIYCQGEACLKNNKEIKTD